MTTAEEQRPFGVLLQRHRLAAGLSQEELAERAGLSRRGISDLERGARRAPYPATARRLAEALGLDATARAGLLASAHGGVVAETAATVAPVPRDSATKQSSDQNSLARTAVVDHGPGPTPRHNLPVQLTSFIGRGQEIAEVDRLLADTHLLTLAGPGGVGKTRLAVRVAEAALEQYVDGVWLVELTSLSEPALVSQTVAAAVGVREQPGRPLRETLADALQHRRLLLVLDNCEQVLATCADLAHALLRACPRLDILATSREPLGIEGEVVWRVPPLSVPPTAPESSLLSLEQYDSIRLFLARARAVQPDFALTHQNTPAVAAVCRRLEGIPLAIELAAARVRVLAPEQIVQRLNDRLRLLAGSSRTIPARQQTLRATLDWSYDLLSVAERAMLDRLSVFAGGWTLEAAEAVVSTPAIEGTGSDAVLDLLTQLVDKSLVLVEPGEPGEVRHHMLETVRQYAQERMAEQGDAEALRHRHAMFFLALAEQAEPELRGPAQAAWLRRLEVEHDNLRAALRWTVDAEEAELGLRLAGAVWRFWWIRGHFGEGRRWFDGLQAVVERGAAVRAATRANALSGAGTLARDQGDYRQGAALLEASLALFRDLGDREGIASSLHNLGLTASYQGDYSRAASLLEEALALSRELGDSGGIALSLNSLGRTITEQGEYSRAVALLQEALAVRRELGDKRGMAWSLNDLARVIRVQGDYARAAALLEESLALRRDLGDKRGIAWSLNDLARVAREQGDYGRAAALLEESLALRRELADKRGSAYALNDLGRTTSSQGDHSRAAALLDESLALFREIGDKPGAALATEALAVVACAQEQPERAARLFGAAEAIREAIGAPLPPADQAGHDQGVAAACAHLGQEAFAAAWAEGRGLAGEQASNVRADASERE